MPKIDETGPVDTEKTVTQRVLHSLKVLSPGRAWMGGLTRETLRKDAVAGFTNAAIVLPQGVAFAVIAGLPPEYGLYTAMITPIVAAIWGSSMIMVSGPTTAISAVLFATISGMAPPGTPEYVSIAFTLTVLVGCFQIADGVDAPSERHHNVPG